ncbi:hypothetical protein D3C72_2196360 [compost metagenome]
MCVTPKAMAVSMSASASVSVWFGSAYIRSRFTLSKCVSAISTACRASSPSWMRPSALSWRGSKLWMPIDSRLMPLAR